MSSRGLLRLALILVGAALAGAVGGFVGALLSSSVSEEAAQPTSSRLEA